MIPFVDLQSQYKALKAEIDPAVTAVMTQCNFVLGQPVADFEKAFAEYCGVKHAIGVANGTEALHLALVALGIKEGDEVITVANTFVATTLAITYCGATPVLVDCLPGTYNMDPAQIEAKITPKTKAIMPVHLYGQLVDIESIMAIADQHGLPVVEDACQGHGAQKKGKKAGAWGKVAGFSFYPGKNLGAYGDGGGITTNDDALAEKIRQLRNLGSPKKYYHEMVGFNSRLDTMQAAVLGVKLPHLDAWSASRARAAAWYNEKLKGVGDIICPDLGEAGSHVFHLYVIRSKQRDALLEHLGKSGVGAGIHYPVPIHRLGLYKDMGWNPADYPNAELFAGEILSLPMFPELTEAQVDEVVAVVKSFF
ncbi:MAG: DegT/DnrJ/EryC1/StrS family aminotransferase [bacterium]|nr:DegT/DnrJ/EryC1/StrS family aminotransferase [bacterium]